jgi:hypothetical protein
MMPFFGDINVLAAFRAMGALDPASARPRSDFAGVDDAAFQRLLNRGVIREGAPGTFYHFAPVGSGSRLVRTASFWVLVILLPLVIIQFCSGAPRTDTGVTRAEPHFKSVQ